MAFLASNVMVSQVLAQNVYQLEIDSVAGLPTTIVDGDTAEFFLTLSSNSPLFYQGDFFVELEYNGNFYEADLSNAANAFIGSSSPNTILVQHKFSTEDDLSIGDNVVVVWPRIGDGVTPEQEVVNPYTTTIRLLEPNGIKEQNSRIRESFISPNPAITGINYNLEKSFKIQRSVLYDLTGKELLSAGSATELDISNLPNGIYFIDVVTEKGNVYSDKLLISR
ncbi:MAG: T9SS type A sorting domain-containing protein [Flavobacteriales bacterium]